MRMHAQTAMIKNGFVHLPKEAGWLAEYLHEMTAFPRGRHDDQVDSTAQMLDWLKQSGREPGGMYQLMKERFLELRRSQAGRALRSARAPRPASAPCSSYPASAGTWPPTARSRCQKRRRAATAGRVGAVYVGDKAQQAG
jgi:hypothetical protein